ncbi:signal peptide peptidase SppA [Persicobacter sp. CCB-QB2]|uniref:signal peptide peptidase SppA n=1 Tax=Persicobacter sp. CCB-QB2 TaxID=1561025 RepID=UPI0006A98484|nr:signal peptide peptidase SppA [Persicobacter sp. CCB-QB2]
MKFLRNVLAALVALTLFFGLPMFFFLMIAMVSGSADGSEPITKESILRLKFSGPIQDRVQEEDPMAVFNKIFGDKDAIGLNQVKKALENAATDEKIKAVYLESPMMAAGPSTALEIHQALKNFREESGKPVFAYSPYYSQLSYYVASAADSLYLNPIGGMDLKGLSANISFFKGTLDKLGIKAEIFRVGDFKSAVEPYFRKNMSEENRLQYQELLGGLNGVMLEGISESRNIDLAKLNNISDSLLVRSTKDAMQYQLVDDLVYEDEINAKLRAFMELEEDDKIPFVGLNRYNNSVKRKVTTSRDKIAVIYADGAIQTGKSEEGKTIGSKTLMEELAKARKDDKVKAVVLRVNSPGGSALASDMIWREVLLTREKKPVIASMGDYAASGGYYISMAADTIVAQPNTITGSIGIFAVLMNFEKFLNDKVGISHDIVKTGLFSDLGNPTRPMSAYERQIIQSGVNEGYEIFTSKAAEGRHMSQEDLLKIAGGRVWTGAKAQELGLVDVMGGLETAIAIAAEKAELEEYKISNRPEMKSKFDQLFEDLNEEVQSKIVEYRFGPFANYAEELQRLEAIEGPQARMVFDLEIE